MGDARTQKFSIRLTADERGKIDARAAVVWVTATELAREVVLRRTRGVVGPPERVSFIVQKVRLLERDLALRLREPWTSPIRDAHEYARGLEVEECRP